MSPLAVGFADRKVPRVKSGLLAQVSEQAGGDPRAERGGERRPPQPQQDQEGGDGLQGIQVCLELNGFPTPTNPQHTEPDMS